MRNSFIEQLTRQAALDGDIMLVVGDLGFSVVEPFAKSYPNQFLNAGVAEQNMAGLAAGLGLVGKNVFIYTIANFPTLRCVEQIRNDICYHGANVKVVSVGAGLAYGSLGYSHHAVQDIACLRGFPGLKMATPGDPVEAKALTRFLCENPGPAYLRLGKAGETIVHGTTEMDERITYPWFPQLRKGNGKGLILCCGSILANVVEIPAAKDYEIRSAAFWGDDEDTRNQLTAFVRSNERVVVIEEHLRSGGFGSFLREALENNRNLQSRVQVLALDPVVCGMVGSQKYLRDRGGLSTNDILSALQE